MTGGTLSVISERGVPVTLLEAHPESWVSGADSQSSLLQQRHVWALSLVVKAFIVIFYVPFILHILFFIFYSSSFFLYLLYPS